MTTSANTTPISPGRFADALKDLSVGMLHLKVLEIRNSIAHLQYSNDQLKPFAEGSAIALSPSSSATTEAETVTPDQDCIDAIRENDQVIDRMMQRIAIIRAEVEERGMSWTEFQSKDETVAASVNSNGDASGDATEFNNGSNTTPHSAWADGTFQTGVIRNGEVSLDARRSLSGQQSAGGSLDDDQLRSAMEERLRQMYNNETDDGGGMHL